MPIGRATNYLGQMRVDVPHLRASESSVAADFDALAGNVLAGNGSYVVRGFSLVLDGALGAVPTALRLDPTDGAVLHAQGSEAGTVYVVPSDAVLETLSGTNSRVIGSWTAGAINYVGIDLRRSADATTTDLVAFLNADTLEESTQTVPLARTLSYVIHISTNDFGTTPTVCAVAKVTVSASGLVTVVEDARQLFFRLGSGGGSPDALAVYPWVGGRTESSTQSTVGTPDSTIFTAGDKAIRSDKEWRDAVMNRLWEIGGGRAWYNATSDRDVKIALTSSVLASGSNVDWTLGSQTLEWKGIEVIFANSPGINNIVTDGSAAGFLTGQCLYVDIDRTTSGTTLVAQVGTLATLGSPTVPGSRFILAWRRGNDVFFRDLPFQVGRVFDLPTPSGNNAAVVFEGPTSANFRLITDADWVGGYKAVLWTSPAYASAILAAAGEVPAAMRKRGMVVSTIETGGGVQEDFLWTGSAFVTHTLIGKGAGAVTATGVGGVGVVATSTTTSAATFSGAGAGAAVDATATGSGIGVRGTGALAAAGVVGVGGVTDASYGVTGTSSATNGSGVHGTATGTGKGVVGTAVSNSGVGVYGTGFGSGTGVEGVGGTSSGRGVRATGGAPNGNGIEGYAAGTGVGVQGNAGATATSAGVEGAASVAGTFGGYFHHADPAEVAIKVSGLAHLDAALVSSAAGAATGNLANALYAFNTPKASGSIASNATTSPSINSAFNVATVTINGSGYIHVTFDVPMVAFYAVVATYSSFASFATHRNRKCHVFLKTTAGFFVSISDDAGANVDISTISSSSSDVCGIDFVVHGAQ